MAITKIVAFVHELKTSIQELYGLKDDTSEESIDVNHLMANLEDSLKSEVKILQLTGNLKLETLLELIETKLEGHPFGASAMKAETPRHTERIYNRSYTDKRLDRLENMMASLLAKVEMIKQNVKRTLAKGFVTTAKKLGMSRPSVTDLKHATSVIKRDTLLNFAKV